MNILSADPTNELVDHFGTDFPDDVGAVREKIGNLQLRRQSEAEKLESARSNGWTGEKRDGPEARVEWLDEQIQAGKRHLEALKERRLKRHQEERARRKELRAEQAEAAADALDALEAVAGHVEELQSLQADVEDSRKQDPKAVKKVGGGPSVPEKAAAKLEDLRHTLETVADE